MGKGLTIVPYQCRWEVVAHGSEKVSISSYEYMRIDLKKLQRKCVDE